MTEQAFISITYLFGNPFKVSIRLIGTDAPICSHFFLLYFRMLSSGILFISTKTESIMSPYFICKISSVTPPKFLLSSYMSPISLGRSLMNPVHNIQNHLWTECVPHEPHYLKYLEFLFFDILIYF